MKKHYAPVLVLQLLIASTAQPLFATEPSATKDKPAMMDEVVVTAGRTEEKKATVSSNVTILTEEEILQTPANNVADLLISQGIGPIKKYPGNLTSVGIRGFRTDTHGNDLQGHVLVLLDGRRAGTGNLAKILTKNVARIEIIRGPGAVQYGSAGMGGVINVITRRGTGNALFVEGYGGSFDTVEGTIGATALRNNLDFAGSLTYGTRGDYDSGSGERYNNTGIDDEIGLSANLGYSFSDTSRLGLVFTGFAVDGAGNPGFLKQNDLDNSSDKENYSADLTFEGECPVTGSMLLARYFFGRDENSWMDPTVSNASGWDTGMGSKNETEQQGAQFQLSRGYDMVSFTAGFDWLDYKVENSWNPQRSDYGNSALFFLSKASFLEDQLSVNIGLRYDWYEVEVKDPAGRSEDDTHFTPQVGLAWMVTESFKLRAQYGEAFMMPSAGQMSADYQSFGARVMGNPDLGPEKSATWEGGLDYSDRGLSGALTYFYTDFEDKIIHSYLADGSQSWQNLGDATLSGFEAEIAYDLGVPMNWNWEVRPYLKMTLLDTYEDDRTGEDLQYISSTSFSTGLVTGNGEGFFCRLNVNYTGSQEVTDYESSFPYPEVTLGSSTVTDLSASYRFHESDELGTMTIRGEVQNLFDEDYAYVKGYPMPGQGFYLGLRWDY